MVEQRRELYFFVLSCDFTHTKQTAQHADPALPPRRGQLFGVLLGRWPSLHTLRRPFSAVVSDTASVICHCPTPINVHVGLRDYLFSNRHEIADECRWGF